MPANGRIRPRRDTAANWRAGNPVLAEGELGHATDFLLAKIGDGATAWNALAWLSVPSCLVQASAACAAGDFVNVYDSAGNPRVRPADATDPDKFANGFVLEAIAGAASGIVLFGGINRAVTPGVTTPEVFLSDATPGGYATAAPGTAGYIVQPLGLAIEGVGVVFAPQTRVLL